MYYSICHVTRFRYSTPVQQSVMEIRMQPRNEGIQRRHRFQLEIDPRATVLRYQDYLGNTVHHFDIPGRHSQLVLTAEALVDLTPPPPLPEALPPTAWETLDQETAGGDYWEMLAPSAFARSTDLLHQFAAEIGLERRDDPLTLLRELSSTIRQSFAYVQNGTQVDSPIDEALESRQGVCQDFAHIMAALGRQLGIPCRYVSGYLYHRDEYDRSAEDATHAWVEAWLPELGWVGFDPTNDLIAGERHIRVAMGRDYADVPPTRGVFKGEAETELSVAVKVLPADEPLPDADALLPTDDWTPAPTAEEAAEWAQQQQQQ